MCECVRACVCVCLGGMRWNAVKVVERLQDNFVWIRVFHIATAAVVVVVVFVVVVVPGGQASGRQIIENRQQNVVHSE